MVKEINLTVRDLASECPIRKIYSLKRSKIDIVQIGGAKTGHDLEELVGTLVTKNFDATTEYDVTFKKRIGGINFVVRGKIDILIRKHESNSGITPQIVELKYNPLFDGKPKKEHIRQVSIYAEIIRKTYHLANPPEAYLQYWFTQNPELAKFTVLVQKYPEEENPFVRTFRIEDTRKIFDEVLFDLARAIAWTKNFPGISPMSEDYCYSCPFRRVCKNARLPEYSRIYELITYEKYLNNEKIDFSSIPDDEKEDSKRYAKDVLNIARRIK